MSKTSEAKKASSRAYKARMLADPERAAEHREYMRKYAVENRQKLNENGAKLYARNRIKIRLQRKGIDPTSELITELENHTGTCDICSGPGDGRWKELSIDHCHETNTFRGMLCSNCNRALGHFQDDPELLSKAILYLKRMRA